MSNDQLRTRIHDLCHRFEVKNGVDWKHKRVFDWGHDVTDRLLAHLKNTRNDVHFVLVQIVEILCHLDQLIQSLWATFIETLIKSIDKIATS